MELAAKKCKPCEGGTPPFNDREVEAMLEKVEGWEWKESKIWKVYRFKDFRESMIFVNQVADIAEQEGHHPDIYISWNKVMLTLTTHAINGLSENDFIIAAKVDNMINSRGKI